MTDRRASSAEFAQLWQRHGDFVRLRADWELRRRGWKDASAAEEVAQAVAYLFARRLERGELDEPRAWLTVAVRNAAIDHVRQETGRGRRSHAVPSEVPERGGWEEERRQREARAWLYHAVAQLPDELREVVTLRLQGLSFAQIAAALDGVHVTTVYRRYEAAKERLRQANDRDERD